MSSKNATGPSQQIEDILDKVYKLGIRHGVKKYLFLNKRNATLVKAKASLLHLIEQAVTEARAEGERFGRADELTKLSEYGWWEIHFEERIKELKSQIGGE